MRPTPERVRETLFDWLTHLTGSLIGLCVCDMFAGSGALGLEAASRGAQNVVILEKDRKSAARISGVVEKFGAGNEVKVLCTDSLQWMKISPDKFDVIFIDPPFAAGLHEAAARAAVEHLNDNGLIYMENDEMLEDAWLAGLGLTSVRRGKAGAVHYLLAERKNV